MALSLQTKRKIDILLPTLGAIGIGYLYFRKNGGKDWRMLLALVIMAWIILYILTSQLTKWRYLAPPADQPLPNDVDGINRLCGTFDPKTVVDTIAKDAYRPWYVVGVRDVAAYTALAALGKCETVKCYNDWKARYYSENQETLPQAIAAESSFLDSAFDAIQTTLAQRFQQLGLS